MNRPAWAAGPEWEGWECFGNEERIYRKTAKPQRIAVEERPLFDIELLYFAEDAPICWLVLDSGVMHGFPSPESALRIANTIAAEFGGWA